jgi:hypothetical protein
LLVTEEGLRTLELVVYGITVAYLRWYICGVVVMYAVMAKVVGVVWMVDVKKIGIMEVARMIVVTKVFYY